MLWNEDDPTFAPPLRYLATICLFLAGTGWISAQKAGFEGLIHLGDKRNFTDTVWIITGEKTLDDNFKKWKADFVLDFRKTLVSNTQVTMGGLRFGAEYRRVHRFGIGLYGLGKGVTTSSLLEVDTAIVESNLNMSYASLFYERVLFFNPKWEWSATIHQGAGTIKGSYRYRNTSEWINYEDKRVRPFEISTTGYYHITWWCSVGAGVGYRYMRRTLEEVRDVYSAPVAIVRLRVKLLKLTRSIWNEDVKYEY